MGNKLIESIMDSFVDEFEYVDESNRFKILIDLFNLLKEVDSSNDQKDIYNEIIEILENE